MWSIGVPNGSSSASKLSKPHVQKFMSVAEEYLGKDFTFKLNKKGDPIFINADNTKRM